MKDAAYATGMRGGEKPKTLKNGAESIDVRPATNGFIVNVYWPPKNKRDFYQPPKPAVFTSAAEVAEYIEKCLGVKDDDDK